MHRDGAILALVDKIIPESEDSTPVHWKKDNSADKDESKKKRKRVMVTMGGDRFKRAFNDTYIMEL